MKDDGLPAEIAETTPTLRRIPVEDALSGMVVVVRQAGAVLAERFGPVLAEWPQRALGEIGRVTQMASRSIWTLRLLAGKGNLAAQRELGYRLVNGDGTSVDAIEAFQWFRRGAAQGDAACQYALGVLYANGQGVPEGKLQAFVWYQKAADQGHAAAQFNLALAYDTGDGVIEDSDKAFFWYLRASEQNYARACFNLGVIYETGDGRASDLKLAREYYYRAAELGFAPAQLLWAGICLNGGLDAVGPSDAWFWYSLAAQGLPPGEDRDLAEQGKEITLNVMTLTEIEATRRRLSDWQSRQG